MRFTINKIAEALAKNSTRMVACFNYTGTPYVENKLLPEVVYAYGLKEAIDNGFLKKVRIQGVDNVKNEEFLKLALTDFFTANKGRIYEGLLPKIAIFASTIDELVNEVKPEVEGILNDLGIDTNTILVNVGDSTITKDADIKDFNNLDVKGTEGSKKQVILLVNKGKEGWNCRSLFAVAMYREPNSKVFVLQSTMRCLRSITEEQQTARVYLSNDNYLILDSELKKNFNLTIDEFKKSGIKERTNYVVKIVPPIRYLTMATIEYVYHLKK